MGVLETLDTSSTMRMNVFHKTNFNVFLAFRRAFGAPPEFSLFIFIKRIPVLFVEPAAFEYVGTELSHLIMVSGGTD